MNEWLSSLRSLNFQVWVQAIGRLFCQVGFGLISFYIPLLFVNQVGLSATSVGFSIGLSSLTEVVAHFIGGSLSDSPRFGRKTALALSAALGIVVSLVLAVSDSLFMLAIASLLLGFSLGFYWTIGYFIGPIMGGWAIDQSPVVSRSFWLVVAASTLVCITLLRIFEIINPEVEPEVEVQPSEGG